jgi:hypothetical protein
LNDRAVPNSYPAALIGEPPTLQKADPIRLKVNASAPGKECALTLTPWAKPVSHFFSNSRTLSVGSPPLEFVMEDIGVVS